MNTPSPRRLALSLLTLVLLTAAGEATETAVPAPAATTVPNSECLECHEAEFKARKKGQPSEWIGVQPDVFAHSAHGKLN